MSKLIHRFTILIVCCASLGCDRIKTAIKNDDQPKIIGTYYNQYFWGEDDSYEYGEIQFTSEGYMLYYNIHEGIGSPSVYKLTTDSTFTRWWIDGETVYKFYRQNDTLFIQLVDSISERGYQPYVPIDPEISLSETFENKKLEELYFEKAWSRYQQFYPE